MDNEVKIYVLKVEQPLGDFYVGALSADVAIKISTADVRLFLDDNATSLEGIQRRLSEKRRKEISEYVEYEFATFPTSIVLSVDERCCSIVESKTVSGFYEMTISGYENKETGEEVKLSEAAFILDGQHRLAGLENFSNKQPFEVNVSIFIGLDKADQAEIFSKVNLTQTRVNKSLVYDLYAYQEKPSPTKLAHKITVALDSDERGPFYQKIKRLGVTTPGRSMERLSQATVVRGILKHLPPRVDEERNKGILGFHRRSDPKDNWKNRIFTSFYRSENQGEAEVFNILTNYFSSVANRWPEAWGDEEQEYMLCSTNGYNALIRFLKPCFIRIVEEEPRTVRVSEFDEIFKSINLPTSKLLTENTDYGSSGESWLYRNLMSLSEL